MVKRKQSGQAGHGINDNTAVLAFLIFLAVVIFLIDAASDQKALADGSRQAAAKGSDIPSREQAEKIVSKLTINSKEEDGIAFIVQDTIDSELLDEFIRMDYEEIKNHLGIKTEFVMHFEDANGRIIPIGDRMCIGSRDVKINGVACG